MYINLDDRESNIFLTLNVLTVNVQMLHKRDTAAMAQLVRALAPHTEGWVFESQPRPDLRRKNSASGRDVKMFGLNCLSDSGEESNVKILQTDGRSNRQIWATRRAFIGFACSLCNVV